MDGVGGALFSDKPSWGWSLKTLIDHGHFVVGQKWTPVGETSRCTIYSFMNDYPCSNIYELSTVFGYKVFFCFYFPNSDLHISSVCWTSHIHQSCQGLGPLWWLWGPVMYQGNTLQFLACFGWVYLLLSSSYCQNGKLYVANCYQWMNSLNALSMIYQIHVYTYSYVLFIYMYIHVPNSGC